MLIWCQCFLGVPQDARVSEGRDIGCNYTAKNQTKLHCNTLEWVLYILVPSKISSEKDCYIGKFVHLRQNSSWGLPQLYELKYIILCKNVNLYYFLFQKVLPGVPFVCSIPEN